MFLTSSNYSEQVVKTRLLNIVQFVQTFAHKLIFLHVCVTRAALWRHAFTTFSFWATLLQSIHIVGPIVFGMPRQALSTFSHLQALQITALKLNGHVLTCKE